MTINHTHPIYTREGDRTEMIEKRFNILYGKIIEQRRSREKVREYDL